MRLRTILILVAILVSLAAVAAEIALDYDRGVDFAAYKSYAWKAGSPAPNPASDARILAAVDKALASKGLRKVDKDPGLWVSYYIVSQKEAKITDWDYGKFKFEGRDVTVKKMLQGTLAVDLVDRATGKLVWRSTATDYVPTNGPPAEGVIEKAVDLMFRTFPPAKEK